MASSTVEAVRTVTQIITKTAASATSSSNAVPPQAGVIEGVNPVHYDPKNPIILFIVQVGSPSSAAAGATG
jgi:hypothetical protein